jgi:hypothetical protein
MSNRKIKRNQWEETSFKLFPISESSTERVSDSVPAMQFNFKGEQQAPERGLTVFHKDKH